MSELEDRIREALEDEAQSAPAPPGRDRVVGRTRRRQVLSLAAALLGVVALTAALVVGVGAVRTSDDGLPAEQPTRTTTLHGISITAPEGWHVFDPDELGLNGPADAPRTLPRLVLAVSPMDPGDLFGCPGMVTGTPQRSLMTVQEEPLALAGESAGPWPVELEPLAIESAGGDPVEGGAGGCYPDWEFLRAGWTAVDRTFEARVGFAPDVGDDERKAMLAAFASMAFEPGTEPISSATLIAGLSAGGETLQLTATRQVDGLSLMLQGRSFGTGIGGFDPTSPRLQLADHVFGSGAEAKRVVFGALPVSAVSVDAAVDNELSEDEALPSSVTLIFDVPDEIDDRLNAFVVTLDPSLRVTIRALDASGEIVATGEVDPGSDAAIGTPVPSPVQTTPEGSPTPSTA
jgi:hypothetical protein